MSISLSGRMPGPIKQAYADYEKKYDKYVKDMSAYNEAAKKWNAGSRTSAFTMPEPVAPTFGYTDEQVQSAVTRDTQLRQQAVDIAFNPQKYNLSGLGFAPIGPNVATTRGAPTRGIVTEKAGIGSLLEDQGDPNVAFESRYGPIRYGTADSEIHTLGDGRQFRREEFDRFGQSFGIAGMSPLQQEYNRFLYRMGQEVQGMRR